MFNVVKAQHINSMKWPVEGQKQKPKYHATDSDRRLRWLDRNLQTRLVRDPAKNQSAGLQDEWNLTSSSSASSLVS